MATSTSPMICAGCGQEMNHHAEKLIHPTGADGGSPKDSVFDGVVEEVHECPACGEVASRRSMS
ncbi:MAG TPA: hypothetical protein VE911_00140 [Candidatus Nitrosopolaris sp.]|nr:hypothetical protein [Candidatus Nitrosopolaris sp.]